MELNDLKTKWKEQEFFDDQLSSNQIPKVNMKRIKMRAIRKNFSYLLIEKYIEIFILLGVSAFLLFIYQNFHLSNDLFLLITIAISIVIELSFCLYIIILHWQKSVFSKSHLQYLQFIKKTWFAEHLRLMMVYFVIIPVLTFLIYPKFSFLFSLNPHADGFLDKFVFPYEILFVLIVTVFGIFSDRKKYIHYRQTKKIIAELNDESE